MRELTANRYNAIRTAHNPASPALLDACDRLGMLVVNEAFDSWSKGKLADDYHLYFDAWWHRDLADMVLRDRNHPSVVIWSIGNEIPLRARPLGASLSRELSDFVRARDPEGRPVTSAFSWSPEWNPAEADDFMAPLDIAGYNYKPQFYTSDHRRDPARVMVATESYPQQSFESWQAVWENEWLIGDFVWTAMDHLGESALGWTAATLPGKGMLETCLGTSPWPWHISYAGDLDICGFKKPQSFYRNVLWDVSPLEMVVSGPAPAGTSEQISAWGWPDDEVSWTWPSISEGAQVTVKVYSKAHDEVELFVNGARVGRAMRGDGGSIAFVNGSWFRGIERLTATFVVPYSPGNLTAVGHVRATGRTDVRTLLTTGMPAALRLAADRTTICASRNDLAYVTVYVVDSAGRHVPHARVDVSSELNQKAHDRSDVSVLCIAVGELRFRGRRRAVPRRQRRPARPRLLSATSPYNPPRPGARGVASKGERSWRHAHPQSGSHWTGRR